MIQTIAYKGLLAKVLIIAHVKGQFSDLVVALRPSGDPDTGVLAAGSEARKDDCTVEY